MIFISGKLSAAETFIYFWMMKKQFMKQQNKDDAVPHGTLPHLFQFCDSDQIEI